MVFGRLRSMLSRSHRGRKSKLPIQKIKIVGEPRLAGPNDFCIIADGTDRYDVIMACPQCGGGIPLGRHRMKAIDKMGRVTVDPSILHHRCGAHFWVRDNLIYFV